MDYVRYFVSLSNADAKTEPPRHLFTADKAAIDAFVKREDRAGRGVFSSIGLFVSGERTRNSNTVVAVPFVVVDCDLKNMAEDREAVLA